MYIAQSNETALKQERTHVQDQGGKINFKYLFMYTVHMCELRCLLLVNIRPKLVHFIYFLYDLNYLRPVCFCALGIRM